VQPDHLRIFTLKHFRTPTLAILAGACLSLLGTNALAESTYGYNAAGTGVVIAKARLNLVINVPKLILLRVGSSGATVDTLTWNSGLTWVTAPGTLTNGNNQATNWDGTAPGTGTTANPAAISAFAWTNSSGGGSLAYAATPFGAGGPALGDIKVTSAAGLAHPAPAVLATASTGATAFARNTLATGSWSFALGGTPAAWPAGQYTSTVTYTATSL
jgi:hypothetical protein